MHATDTAEAPTRDLLRIPPHNAAAECALLGTLIMHPERLKPVVAFLAPDDFYAHKHQRIYQTLAGMYLADRAIDHVLLLEELERYKALEEVGGRPYLSTLVQAAALEIDVVEHARLVREKAVARGLLYTAEGVARSVIDGEAPADTLAHALGRLDELSSVLSAANGTNTVRVRPTAEILAAERTDAASHHWAYVVAPKTLTLLVGTPKAGKTYLVASFLAEMCRSGRWANREARPIRALYLTEESDATIQPRIERFGVGQVDWVTPGDVPPGWSWHQVSTWLVEKATAEKYDLVVLDTIRHWCDIDDENDSTAIRRAMKPLATLRARGPAVIAVHHSVKDREARGVRAVAGSLALAGAADVIVSLRQRDETDPEDPHRVVEVQGRYPEGEGSTVIKLCRGADGMPDYYEFVGSMKDSLRLEDEALILATLAGRQGWFPRDVLRREAGLSKNRFDTAMPFLTRTSRVASRAGPGRGGPLEYAAPRTPADAPRLTFTQDDPT